MGESIDRELSLLERQLTALRVEYERFFANDLRKAPLMARRKMEETLRRMGQMEIDRAADRFRLQSLQSRFNAFAELWEKRQVAREEGRDLRYGRTGPIAPPVHPASPAASAASAPTSDDAGGPASVRERRIDFRPLFDRYCAARRELGEDVSKIRYEKFEEAIRRQAEEIRQRTGAARLVFEVQTAEGRVRLVGRPAAPKG